MLITKTSPLTGFDNTMNLPITQEQLDDWKSSRKVIQEVFPNLSAVEREFLISGYTSDDWEMMFGAA